MPDPVTPHLINGRRTLKRKIVVNDRMQRGYVYCRTEPSDGTSRRIPPELTPEADAAAGCVRRKVHDRLPPSFRRSWFAARNCRRSDATSPQLLRRQRVAVARGLAAERLDPATGSARLVSMVLPVLHRSQDGRTMRGRSGGGGRSRGTSRRSGKHCEPRRSRVPPEAAAGGAPLGLRQPAVLTHHVSVHGVEYPAGAGPAKAAPTYVGGRSWGRLQPARPEGHGRGDFRNRLIPRTAIVSRTSGMTPGADTPVPKPLADAGSLSSFHMNLVVGATGILGGRIVVQPILPSAASGYVRSCGPRRTWNE